MSQYKCNLFLVGNARLQLMEFAQVTENREGRISLVDKLENW